MSSPLRTFLETIYKWDGDEAATFKVFCTLFTPSNANPGAPPTVVHHGYSNIDAFERAIRYWVSRGETVYTANSSFKEAYATRTTGSSKVKRKGDNVSRTRCLFLDLDAGPNKAYPNPTVARAALDKMVADAGLWPPTLVVDSGMGLHAYWVFDEPLEPSRWQPLAERLKVCCKIHQLHTDDAVTADIARILRPPESFNYKYGQPLPVKMHVTGSFYTVTQIENMLQRFKVRVVGGTQAHAKSPDIPPPPRPMKGTYFEKFTAGVDDAAPSGPIDIDAVAQAGCGVVADALKTGGAGHSEPLWQLLLLLATFCIDGEEVAHELSRGHAGYVEAETDAKYQAKLQAKIDNDLGWPRCATFDSLGCKQCKTCPHRAANKSPLNIAPKPQADPTRSSGPTELQQGITSLPPLYIRGNNDVIFKETTAKDGAPTTIQVTPYPFYAAQLTEDASYMLIELYVGRRVVMRDILAMASTDFAGQVEFMKFWTSNNVTWPPHMAREGYAFMVAWRNHIREIAAKTDQYAKLDKIGWSGDDAFVYGDKAYTKDGTKRAVVAGMKLAHIYTPRGSIEPWKEAAAYFTDNGWVAHQTIVATAFGSPLMEMTGVRGSAVLAFFTPQSGRGKTTAVSIAQSVWGNPSTGILKADDTVNAINETMATIRHLPIYWDEAQQQNQALGGSHAVKHLVRAAEGVSKRRLNRESQFRPQDAFSQISVITSNESLHAHVVANESMGAVMRLLEFEVPTMPLVGSPGALEDLTRKLNYNYGHVGVLYAQYLGSNAAAIGEQVRTWRSKLYEASGNFGEERYWWSAAAAIIVGAQIANKLGLAKFDVRGIIEYVYTGIMHMRGEAKEATAATGDAFNAEDFIASLISKGRQNFMIMTKGGLIRSAGKPGKVDVQTAGQHERVTDCWAQYDMKNQVIRVAKKPFIHWVAKTYPKMLIKTLLEDLKAHKIWDGKQEKLTIGAGVPSLAGANLSRPQCYDFNVASVTVPDSSPGSP